MHLEITHFPFAVALSFAFAIGAYGVMFKRQRERLGVILLFAAAFSLRLAMIALDPMLHEWDERYHALVAKNMMGNPFTPMMRVEPIMEYDYTAWCCNHIWVHKQPLFLWLMAASMKVFGTNLMALRLPAALLGAFAALGIFRIGYRWTGEKTIGFTAALLFTFCQFQLELTSGIQPLDHNDGVFSSFVILSFWAFFEYWQGEKKRAWALMTGVLAGCAVLVKWLTGIMVFGPWFLLLAASFFKGKRQILDFFLSVLTCIAVFLPWQLYILWRFPKESHYEFEHNARHITEVLDSMVGGWDYHITKIGIHYYEGFEFFVVIGFLSLLLVRRAHRALTLVMALLLVVVYGFFAYVATKMSAFVFPVAGIVIVFGASGLHYLFYRMGKLKAKTKFADFRMGWVAQCAPFVFAFLFLKIHLITEIRDSSNQSRNYRIMVTQNIKKLNESDVEGRILLTDCPTEELMFFKDVNAYHWYFPQSTIDSLQDVGYSFTALRTRPDQTFPSFLLEDERVQKLDLVPTDQ